MCTDEASSDAVYQRLVFDVTADCIARLCDVDNSSPWQQHQQRVTATRPVPKSADEAKSLITASVLQQLGLTPNRPTLLPRYMGRVKGQRQFDRVDEVLGAELVEEESLWTDYSSDQLSVKMKVTDMLCDMLISDTVSVLSHTVTRKCQQRHLLSK